MHFESWMSSFITMMHLVLKKTGFCIILYLCLGLSEIFVNKYKIMHFTPWTVKQGKCIHVIVSCCSFLLLCQCLSSYFYTVLTSQFYGLLFIIGHATVTHVYRTSIMLKTSKHLFTQVKPCFQNINSPLVAPKGF